MYLVLGGFILFAAYLRFYHLDDMGFRFCDEGARLMHPKTLNVTMTTPSLYFKHGLMIWIFIGLKIFGFNCLGALTWSIVCGLFSVIFVFALWGRYASLHTALFASIIYGSNYYIFFYQRSNMSDGYALNFFILILFLITVLFQGMQIIPVNRNKHKLISSPSLIFLTFLVTGMLIGLVYTVRIQSCVTVLGVLGALGLALFLQPTRDRWKWKNVRRYSVFIVILLGIAFFSYCLFMYFIQDMVKWKETLVFYEKNYDITRKLWNVWKPYVIINIWKLSSFSFLSFALLGVCCDTINCLNLNLVRRWLLICFWGLFFASLKMALPWPRAYLYLIFILTIYWVLAFEYILSLKIFNNIKPPLRYSFLTLCLLLTVISELTLIVPFINKKSRYNEAVAYIESKGPGNLHTTHARPIFSMLSFPHSTYIVYDTSRVHTIYQDFCVALKAGYEEKGVRYMVFDHNISYFGGDTRMLQQFVVTVLPDVVLKNDFGEDYHTCMDAFASPPKHDVFTDKIMIYDMENFRKIPRIPIPYFNNKRTEQIFFNRLKNKYSEENGSI